MRGKLLRTLEPATTRLRKSVKRTFSVLIGRNMSSPVASSTTWLLHAVLGRRTTTRLLQSVQGEAGELRARARLQAYLARTTTPQNRDVWRRRHQDTRSRLGLLRDGYPLPPASRPPARSSGSPHTLMYLHNSLPFFSGGYATRSHGVLSAVRNAGYHPSAVTRLGFPWDLPQRDDPPPSDLSHPEEIDGISYHRLWTDGKDRYALPLKQYLDASADALEAFLSTRPCGLIHAASFASTCGLPAAMVARRLGLPFVYEVRGLAYLTHMSRNPRWAGSDEDHLDRRLEAEAAGAADAVFAITEAVKDELVGMGVDRRKIHVLPNCVNADRFVPSGRDAELERDLGLQDTVVIGYIGGFVDYEGLDERIRAFAQLRGRTSTRVKLLMVGDGPLAETLRRMTHALHIEDDVLFTGRVPHEEVARYYSLVDVAPFPRVALPVCEAVSPIKPFEAMAMEKTVVVSSVRALTEIVRDDETGLVFDKGSVDSLASVLQRAVADRALRRHLGTAAREWTLEHRTWQAASLTVREVYDRLLGDRPEVAVKPGSATQAAGAEAVSR